MTERCYESVVDTNGAPYSLTVPCKRPPEPVQEVTTTTPPAPPVQVSTTRVEDGGFSLGFSGWAILLALVLAGLATHPATSTRTRRVLGWPGRARSLLGCALRWVVLGVGALYAVRWLVSSWQVLGFAGLVALGVVLWARRSPAKPPAWHDEEPLVDAFLAAGVLRMGKVRPRLGRHGAPLLDEHGAAVTVVLPRGMTASAVQARHEALASALGVPAAHLTVSAVEGQAPSVVRLRVGTTPPRQAKPSEAEGKSGATWGPPIRLGEDERGRAVRLQVENTHTLVAGASGSGKTLTSRIVALTAALDPRVTVVGLDGKGDGLDWAPLVPSCRTFIDGVRSVEDVARLVEMLTWVLDESERIRARALVDNVRPRPSVLLILEEVYVARTTAASLDAKQAKVLDGLLTRILAGARSAGVHVLVISQRGTDSYVPNDVQANVTQRVVGGFTKRAEFLWALGDEPVREPGAPGEFVVRNGTGQSFMYADLLTDAAWQEGCRRAAQGRGVSVGGSVRVEPSEALSEAPAPVFDLLADEVRRILQDGPDVGMSATELHARMDPLSRPDTPLALGRALSARRDVFVMTRTDARRWTVVKASGSRRVSVGDPSSDGAGASVNLAK